MIIKITFPNLLHGSGFLYLHAMNCLGRNFVLIPKFSVLHYMYVDDANLLLCLPCGVDQQKQGSG